MVMGYAAFAKHLGLYPHSGTVIPQIDCTPFKTSKSGVLFTPTSPCPTPCFARSSAPARPRLLRDMVASSALPLALSLGKYPRRRLQRRQGLT
jgi:hypothetical protein